MVGTLPTCPHAHTSTWRKSLRQQRHSGLTACTACTPEAAASSDTSMHRLAGFRPVTTLGFAKRKSASPLRPHHRRGSQSAGGYVGPHAFTAKAMTERAVTGHPPVKGLLPRATSKAKHSVMPPVCALPHLRSGGMGAQEHTVPSAATPMSKRRACPSWPRQTGWLTGCWCISSRRHRS